MHQRIDNALRALRQDLPSYLDEPTINAACRLVGHTWRQCVLPPVAIVHWFIIQVLHGNTALKHISLLADRQFTDSAYCQARFRLPLALFQAVLKSLVRALTSDIDSTARWLGHRTFLLDGSSFSMPDTPELQAYFGQSGCQRPGCGFPTAKVLALFHAGTGMLIEILAAPLRTGEMSQIEAVHPMLKPDDVLVADRGFCSFVHLALLAIRGVHAVFRIHQKQIVDFAPGRRHARPRQKGGVGLPRTRWIKQLGPSDQIVEWFRPTDRPAWMSGESFLALPESLSLRELRYELRRPGFRTRTVTLVTTLLDVKLYPSDSLAALYGMRWQVETHLKHLKTTMRFDVCKCMTVQGVLKEMTVYAIVYNLVRLVMAESARRRGVPVERISFIDALRWLREGTTTPDLSRLTVNPERPNRIEPRAIKRRPKEYDRLNKPRKELRKRLLDQHVAA
jgi:Transposase DDE domain